MNSGLSWDEFRTGQVSRGSPFVGWSGRNSGRQSFDSLSASRFGGSLRSARVFSRRSRSGYEPTAAGEEMIALASTMAESVLEFERRVAGRDIKPTGELTVYHSRGDRAALHASDRGPVSNSRIRGIVVELILSNQSAQSVSPRRRHRDSLDQRPAGNVEVGRRICTARWSVYCRRDLIAGLGSDATDKVAFIGFGDTFGSAPGRRDG